MTIPSLKAMSYNILSTFEDPFEFEGDYGAMNAIREKVFNLVVSQESLALHRSEAEVLKLMQKPNPSKEELKTFKSHLLAQAIAQDQQGPSIKIFLSEEFMVQLIKSLSPLNDPEEIQTFLQGLLDFREKFQKVPLFRFLKQAPIALLLLDKALRDAASSQGRSFSPPLLSSKAKLEGKTKEALRSDLLCSLMTRETLEATKPQEEIQKSLLSFDENRLKELLTPEATIEDLKVFQSPIGQIVFYALYQILHLDRISQAGLIEEVNKVKELFKNTLGNPTARAQQVAKIVQKAQIDVLFLQESNLDTQIELEHQGFYLSQKQKNGSLLFLKEDLWEQDPQRIPIEGYQESGAVNAMIALHKGTNRRFFLASCHGHSTDPADGRAQIISLFNQYQELLKNPENKGLQFLIGTDANTKTEKDQQEFMALLDRLGLMAAPTEGPTTQKKRQVSVQHDKVGRRAEDREDYILTLKPKNEDPSPFLSCSIGTALSSSKSRMLPDLENPSDHLPVIAEIRI